MRYILTLILLFSFASAATTQISTAPSIKLPSLGSCDEYTDYFIYKCMPFKCNLPIGNYKDVHREMEIIGEEDGKCIHNIKFIMRDKRFPPADSYIYCKLSENGKLEMANLFTRYKKGDLKVYTDPMLSKLLKQECEFGNKKKS